jgi:hypothetical protein
MLGAVIVFGIRLFINLFYPLSLSGYFKLKRLERILPLGKTAFDRKFRIVFGNQIII